MSRTVSATAKAAALAQQTDQVFIVLLEIDHADLDAPIRVANNGADVVSNGDTYSAFPFEITMPSDQDENLPQATLTIDNVDRSIVNAVRTITSAATVTVSVVLASSPDDVEMGPYELSLRNVSWNAGSVTGVLTAEDILNEPFPGEFMTPELFPGLF